MPRSLKYIEHFEVMNMEARRRFVGSGYAWVDVDVRGSGASEGHRKYGPWHQDELDDAREILDWIVARNWSNGVIGAFGTSLEGVCAEMLLAHLHPAVKAVSPRFAPFDIYTDIAFPGGVPTSWFLNMWQLLNNHFDTNTIEDFLGFEQSLLLSFSLSFFLSLESMLSLCSLPVNFL